MIAKIYLITLPILLALDFLWLAVVSKSFYQKHLGHLMSENINWIAAASFYCIFAAGLVVFAIMPSLEKHSIGHALLLGGFLGFVAYATYDLTNLATLKEWPTFLTYVDMLWGVALSSIVAGVVFLIVGKVGLV